MIDNQKNLVRVAAQSANWSQSEAFQKTETMLQAHPNLRGLDRDTVDSVPGEAIGVADRGSRGEGDGPPDRRCGDGGHDVKEELGYGDLSIPQT